MFLNRFPVCLKYMVSGHTSMHIQASNERKKVVPWIKGVVFPQLCCKLQLLASFKLVQRAFHGGTIMFFDINSEVL